jgi:hypothetical protein
MGAVWLRSRTELRDRWKTWLAVALLAGIGAGIGMAAFGAAERVEHTYPDFVAAGEPLDVLVPGASRFGLVGGVDLADVGRLPQVTETADASALLLFAGHLPDGRLIGPGDVFPVAAAGNALGTTFERWKMLEGRPARPFAPLEATASFLAAEELGLKVGDTVRFHFFSADGFQANSVKLISAYKERLTKSGGRPGQDYEQLADGPDLRFRIVGIEASPAEFPPLPADISPVIHLTRSFYERYNDRIVQSPLLYTQLRRGAADLPAFERRVEQMAGDQPVAFVTTRATHTARVQRAIQVQASALRIFGLIVVAAFLVLMQQTLSRQVRVEAADDRTLRAFGMSSGQLIALPMIWAALVAVPAAAVAAGLTILLSPFGVVGTAAKANPDPGVAVHPTVLIAGVVGVLIGIPLLTLWPAIRRARASRAAAAAEKPVRSSRIARSFARGGAAPATSVGVNFGLSAGRGTASVPLFSAVVGFSLAVALLIATIGFGTSLQRVLDTPRLYGWTWDIKTGAPALPNIGGLVVPALRADDDIAAAAAGTVIQADLQDERVDTLAMTVVKGALAPAMIDGRAPRGAGEVLVGEKTLSDIDAGIGDTVTIRIGDSAVPVRIVGTAVFPPYGDNGQFGTGALVSYGQLQELLPAAKQNVFLLRLAPDVPLEREYHHLRDALEPLPTRLAQTPTDLENLMSIGGIQGTLVAILAILGAGTLAHTLITSVRRRRTSIALLRSMGFARRQVWGLVLVQALTLAVVALVLGVILGLIGARVAWAIFADHLGLTAGRAFPWSGLLVLVPGALVLTVAIAAFPAYLAGRTKPAAALREE